MKNITSNGLQPVELIDKMNGLQPKYLFWDRYLAYNNLNQSIASQINYAVLSIISIDSPKRQIYKSFATIIILLFSSV
jgi:hypothetical protein